MSCSGIVDDLRGVVGVEVGSAQLLALSDPEENGEVSLRVALTIASAASTDDGTKDACHKP